MNDAAPMIVPGSIFDGDEETIAWLEAESDSIKEIARSWPLGAMIWIQGQDGGEFTVIGWRDVPEPILVLVATDDLVKFAGDTVPYERRRYCKVSSVVSRQWVYVGATA